MRLIGLRRHCERSEAIQGFRILGCFAALAMTRAALAMSIIGLVLCLTIVQAVKVAMGDYGVPETQLAIQAQTKPVIKHEALFGAYQGNKPLQETGLNLQLSAVFAMQDPLNGSAVISASGRKPLLQIVGDIMPGGIKLKEVHQDYVVLEQAGEQTVLRLPKKSL